MAEPPAPAISAPIEDYVKVIYALTLDPEQAASTSQIADRLGITAGSVSTMIKRMDGTGLAEHVPYRGVRLTPAGRQLALGVIRRHRLLELFLATTLDIPWEDVHRFAETLEHAASDELIELIAAKLGDPIADPHGDPIPNRSLEVDDRAQPTLDDLSPGEQAQIVRVSDADPAMLRYLTEEGIGIGDRLELVDRDPFGGSAHVRIGTRTHSLGVPLAKAIWIHRL
ncbi:MAG: metal-dependent transcriptional regulator [Solirubrobacteraceae bacterium]